MAASSEATLENYANRHKVKVYTTQMDLPPHDKPMVEMAAWCAKHEHIMVMASGLILSSQPTSRDIQNCKIVMLNKGITPGRVVPATPALIAMLMANAHVASGGSDFHEPESVSEQQQRLRMLVREARQAHASDIHIEVRQDVARIRFRKHGELYLHAEWLAKLGRELASVAFNKETDNAVSHFNPMVPQSASMSLRLDGHEIRLRLASMPAQGGFDVVMRVLATAEDHIASLSELGYQNKHIELLEKACRMPHGAVLIAGPTGSGKTTTVASCLQLIPRERKTYTIEEPVEKVVATATQVPVNTEHNDRGFASMGRAALRMDPDVMVLGEMRDEETAQVMVRAALTGHLVFSTLHTNSATGIVTRLVDMGISPNLLADSNVLVSLICQRLVPTLCRHCKIPIAKGKCDEAHLSRWQALLGGDVEKLFVRGHDCSYCHDTGLEGRTVVAEMIWVDDAGREFIKQVDTIGWEKYLRTQGWVNYKEHALQLLRDGICDPHDIERIIGELHIETTVQNFRYDV